MALGTVPATVTTIDVISQTIPFAEQARGTVNLGVNLGPVTGGKLAIPSAAGGKLAGMSAGRAAANKVAFGLGRVAGVVGRVAPVVSTAVTGLQIGWAIGKAGEPIVVDSLQGKASRDAVSASEQALWEAEKKFQSARAEAERKQQAAQEKLQEKSAPMPQPMPQPMPTPTDYEWPEPEGTDWPEPQMQPMPQPMPQPAPFEWPDPPPPLPAPDLKDPGPITGIDLGLPEVERPIPEAPPDVDISALTPELPDLEAPNGGVNLASPTYAKLARIEQKLDLLLQNPNLDPEILQEINERTKLITTAIPVIINGQTTIVEIVAPIPGQISDLPDPIVTRITQTTTDLLTPVYTETLITMETTQRIEVAIAELDLATTVSIPHQIDLAFATPTTSSLALATPTTGTLALRSPTSSDLALVSPVNSESAISIPNSFQVNVDRQDLTPIQIAVSEAINIVGGAVKILSDLTAECCTEAELRSQQLQDKFNELQRQLQEEIDRNKLRFPSVAGGGDIQCSEESTSYVYAGFNLPGQESFNKVSLLFMQMILGHLCELELKSSEIIEGEIDLSCPNEEGEPNIQPYTGTGIAGLSLQAKALIQMNRKILEELCSFEIPEPIALVPEEWEVRLGAGIPQLVVSWGEVITGPEGGEVIGTSKWPITIPHYRYSTFPELPRYTKGNTWGRVILRDNSRLVVNANSESEVDFIMSYLIPLVNPAMLISNPPRIDKGPRYDVEERKVAPTLCKFFSTGQKNTHPDWSHSYRAK